MNAALPFGNRLLAFADAATQAQLRPFMEWVELERLHTMGSSGIAISHHYFIEDGIASIVAVLDGREVEIGLVGREGMTGISVIQSVNTNAHETYQQMPGRAWRIAARDLQTVLADSPDFRIRLLQYSYVLGVQVAENAACNALFTLDQRLARWLLTCHDRTRGDTIAVTHELLSVMLGCRRPTVTVTVQALEGTGAIKATRGLIEIRNRALLLEIAGEAYGTAASENFRVLGAF